MRGKKAQLSFTSRPVLLVMTIALLIFMLNMLWQQQVARKTQEIEIDMRAAATGTLNLLSGSEDCLAVTTPATKSVYAHIASREKLDMFAKKYRDIEPECARNFQFGYRATVEQFCAASEGAQQTPSAPSSPQQPQPGGSQPAASCDLSQPDPCSNPTCACISKPVSGPFSAAIDGKGAFIQDVSITNNRGHVKINNEYLPVYIYERHDRAADNLIIYDGIATKNDNFYAVYFHCRPDNSLFTAFYESPQMEMKDEAMTGSCSAFLGESQTASQLLPVSLDFSGINRIKSFRITGSDISLDSGIGKVRIGGEEKTFYPFSAVDCTGCEPDRKWYELHSVLTSGSANDVCFGIFYLMLNSQEVSLQYGICPNTMQRLGQASYTASWEKLSAQGITKYMEGAYLRAEGDVCETWSFGADVFSQTVALKDRIRKSLPIAIRVSPKDIRVGRITIDMVDGDLERLSGFIDESCILGKQGIGRRRASMSLSLPVSFERVERQIKIREKGLFTRSCTPAGSTGLWASNNEENVKAGGKITVPGISPQALEAFSIDESRKEAALSLYFDRLPEDSVQLLGSSFDGNVYTIDKVTGAAKLIANVPFYITDIAYSPAGELFGIGDVSFFRVDKATGKGSRVSIFNFFGTTALEFGADGTLYGATQKGDLGDGIFMKIDEQAGVGTMVGRFSMGSSGDLAFDDSGTLYATADSEPADTLIKINPSTADVIQVGSTGFNKVYGLVFYGGELLAATNDPPRLLRLDTFTGMGSEIAAISGMSDEITGLTKGKIMESTGCAEFGKEMDLTPGEWRLSVKVHVGGTLEAEKEFTIVIPDQPPRSSICLEAGKKLCKPLLCEISGKNLAAGDYILSTEYSNGTVVVNG